MNGCLQCTCHSNGGEGEGEGDRVALTELVDVPKKVTMGVTETTADGLVDEE